MTAKPAPDPHAQVVVDRLGIVRYWSNGCERLFGYSAESVSGRPVDFVIAAPYRERHWQAFRAAMEARSSDRPQSAGNIPVLHADGTLQLHPFRQIQLCDAFGHGSGAVVIFSPSLAADQVNGLDTVFAEVLTTAQP